MLQPNTGSILMRSLIFKGNYYYWVLSIKPENVGANIVSKFVIDSMLPAIEFSEFSFSLLI